MEDHYYVVPDIHGRLDLLEKAFVKIQAIQSTGKIIFLGDYVDRGNDSAGVVQAVRTPADGWEHVCLKGNHEDMLIYDYCNSNPLYCPKTILSFGGYLTSDVIDWLNNLRLYHIVDKNIFVHAAWNVHLPIGQQSTQTLLWDRYGDSEPFNHPEGFYLTHGHTPRQNGPIRALNRINLDCGAVYYDRLVIGVYKYGIRGPIDFIEVK